MRISDWSSYVCSSDLGEQGPRPCEQIAAERVFAQRGEIVLQLPLGHSHPRREPRADPPRHLCRTRIREGEAQDRPRIAPAHPHQEIGRPEYREAEWPYG